MNKKHEKIDLEDISKEEIYENLQRCISEKIDYWNRINKAIEYIDNHFLYHYGSEKRPIVFEDNYIQEIVDILRGEDNER